MQPIYVIGGTIQRDWEIIVHNDKERKKGGQGRGEAGVGDGSVDKATLVLHTHR